METVLSGMISNLVLLPAPPPQAEPTDLSSVHHPQQLETAGTPTPPNSSTSTSTSLAIRTPSATSPATNSSTPGAFHAGHQQMVISPSAGSQSNLHAADSQQPQQQQQQPRTNKTFFRPPGLGPEGVEGDESFPTNGLVCPHCGFGCSSKFHYNSHMNTHNTHHCSMCSYQSRTEGRLKKHMQQSHTHEDRVAAGISISPAPVPTTMPSMQQEQNSPNGVGNGDERACMARGDAAINGAIPTSIGPFLNSMLTDTPPNGTLSSLESLQSMLNNTNPLAQFSNSDALLKICTDAIANNGPNEKAYNSPQMGDLGPTALDQLRALAERQAANLLATSTANALGFVGNMQISQDELMLGGPHENGIRDETVNKPDAPRRSGKPKQYKCKQCPHISRSKKEQWAHARLHIPKTKQLTCSLCDFVTEYKHHLEYHYRNHNGQKPFKCSTCAYTCVNKSMLNSHMKSHTPVYQFRCQDCTYQTKYCHSLKMHLKKYNHKRAPGPGGSDSSDSHGEERPENASSSSVGKDESFENGAPSHSQSGGEMAEGNELAMHSTVDHHHALLMAHQPMMDAEMELASQRYLLEQQLQLEQMNELIRNAVVNCPHCNFSTGNIDEMNRHLLFHLIATQQQLPPLSNEQQALASIYQRLTAQFQHDLTQEGPIQQDPSFLLSQALASGHTAQEMPMEFDKTRHIEREMADGIRQQHHNTESTETHTTPVTTVASLLNTMERRSQMPGGAEDTASSHSHQQIAGSSSSSSSGFGTSNIKREFHQQHFHHFPKPMAVGDNNERNERMASGTCVVKNVMGQTLMLPGFSNGFPQSTADGNTANGLLNTIANANENASNLPFFCQQCEIAFKDAVLYQLHRGYHSIESPFKCNRCGHLSGSALEFNLHLYQAKHE